MINPNDLVGAAISDAEIAWGCSAMGLPGDAFAGEGGTDPRKAVLKRLDQVDVEACPGSGKTTLLVTKLAILAKKWRPNRSGVCVLSHTNVARNEIEERLGPLPEGSTLLRHPHFVGTIHSFVNEFIALPWLRSHGAEIRIVDTEIALDHRWRLLPFRTKKYLERRHQDKSCLTYSSPDFEQGGMSTFPSHTETHQKIVEVCKRSFGEGYFCYDEMFVWANHAIETCPLVTTTLRRRFPLVFIDEVQDNNELQSALLWRVFFAGESPSIRQRFGDSNQAIFQQDERSAVTDPFPDSVHVDLPNSHRFGPEIAKFADPLGVRPHGLVGCGPRRTPTLGPLSHTIFLFNDNNIRSVLPSFAQLLLDSFTPDEIARSHFSAVAAVHNKDGDNKIPRSLKHYAPDYDPTIASSDSKPATLLQYVRSTHRYTVDSSNSFELVKGFANGVLRLMTLVPGNAATMQLRSAHRAIERLLSDDPERLKDYRTCLRALIDCCGQPDQKQWESEICPRVRRIATTLTGAANLNSAAGGFLSWTAIEFHQGDGPLKRHLDNVFCYPEGNHRVRIHLGSIHSVKGETHTATLVLETFFYKHHLSELKPWLLGRKTGAVDGPAILQGRLRLHYVAMTRPSTLLCLAMRDDSLSADEKEALSRRGWRLAQCTA